MLKTRLKLNQTASAIALGLSALFAIPAYAETDQKDRYHLRMTTQIFDGNKEFSHTQAAGLARIRNGDQSYVQLDFQDGFVAFERDNSTEIAKFRNTSGQEAAFLYDYKTHSLSGGNDVSEDFNRYIRPLMAGNVTRGEDARWIKSVQLDQLGIEGVFDGQTEIELSRKYFAHQGEDYVLVAYNLPAFQYTAEDGTPVIHWGQSMALLDANMSKAYWNNTLHRAVAGDSIQQMRPYRFAKSIAMSDENGDPVLDIRDMPDVWEAFEPFYSDSATGAIPFSGSNLGGQTPIKVAVRLDILGLSLAENSGNQLGEITAQQQNGNRGQEVADQTATTLGYTTKGASLAKLQVLYEVDTTRMDNAVRAYKQKVAAIAVDLRVLSDKQDALIETIENRNDLLREANLLEKAHELDAITLDNLLNTSPRQDDRINRLFDTMMSRESRLHTITESIAEIETGAIRQGLIGSGPSTNTSLVLGSSGGGGGAATGDRLLDQLQNTQRELRNLEHTYDALAPEGEALAKAVTKLEAQRLAFEKNGIVIKKAGFIDQLTESSPRLKSVLTSKSVQLAAEFGDELLTTAGDVANIYTTGKAGYNVYDAATSNKASGEIGLVRSYGTPGSALDLGLDIGGLFLSAATGDLRGFVSDGVAITAGSMADIFVSGKALKDINQLNNEATRLGSELTRARSQQHRVRSQRQLEQYALITDIMNSDLSQSEKDRLITQVQALNVMRPGDLDYNRLKQIAAEANMAISNETASRARNDEDSKPENRQDLADRLGKDKDDFWKAYEEEQRKQAEEEQRREAIRAENERGRNATIEEDPQYPTRDPSTIKVVKDKIEEDPFGDFDPTESLDVIDDILTDYDPNNVWIDPYADFDLEEYQRQVLLAREEAHQEWLKSLRKDPKGEEIGAGVRSYEEHGVRHLVFTSVDWNAPEFEPPKWVPVGWEPPKFSGFDWTNFDDDDWPSGESSLSLTFATDTSNWDEWIDQIGRRKLERLAKQAGFYTLAEALKNWNLLLNNLNDPNWVKWAQSPPGCSPSLGCGPSYQGRWSEGLARLELARLIDQSRDVFSTAGLSDVAIFGFNLEYMMRDFGLEDGDLVQIVVTQFGREIFSQELSLLNNGTDFDVRLNPGVASLTITALNEGAISPNTAQITIDNVAEGESDQTYSLLEGEQAVLRVESGR
ncbi:MAG: hypothetical protein Hens3KO_15820 [Henriciella sp.]